MPLSVAVETGDRPVSGQLLISSDTVVIRRRIDLPAPSIRTFRFLLAPHSLHPAIGVRLVSGGTTAAAKLQPLKAVGPSALLVCLLGDTSARFAALRQALPQGALFSSIESGELPQDFRGWDAADLLIIGDLSSELTKPQRQAVTAWLHRGGRMLIIMPAGGVGPVSSFWRTFLPAKLIAHGFELRDLDLAAGLRSAGLDVFTDEKHAGLVGFSVGLGRVLLSAYGHGPPTATEESRREIAKAAVRLLGFDAPGGRPSGPLVDAGVYDLFNEAAWPRPARTGIWLSALGYALVMAITLKALGRERPVVFAACTVAFAAAFTAVIYFAVLPRSTATVQGASIARTRSGASALAATRYLHFASPADRGFEIRFEEPARPLFFSDTMLSHGPVYIEQADGAWLHDVPAGGGRPSCFEQTGIIRFGGSIEVLVENARYEITNNATSAATGEPLTFTDLILTDCADGVLIGELPCGKTVSVDFSPDKSVRLGRLVWDTSAGRPYRYRMLRRWLADHPPGRGTYLLGWNRLRLMPPFGGRFMSAEEKPTLWEIEIE